MKKLVTLLFIVVGTASILSACAAAPYEGYEGRNPSGGGVSD